MPAPDRTRPLPRSRPEGVGLDPGGVEAFLDSVAEGGVDLHSLMVLRRGHVAAEAWWAPYSPERPHLLYSLSKSFAAVAVGLLVAEGRARLDEPLAEIFPESLPESVSPNLAAMTVRHLLNMTTGHEEDDLGRDLRGREDGDWVRGFLARPVPREPGTHWIYNSSASYMLSALVARRTGERLLDYLAPRLFEPLGIPIEAPGGEPGGATWQRDPKGIDVGGWGLSLRTEDVAKFGRLLLEGGGDLLPAGFLAEATRRQAANGDGAGDWGSGYGYQFWMCDPPEGSGRVYRGDGAFAQLLVVVPDRDLVVVVTANADIGAVLNRVWTHLLPAAVDAEGTPGGEPLRRGGLAIPFVAGGGPTETPVALHLAENPMGWTALRLLPDVAGARVELDDAHGTHPIAVGHEDWASGRTAFGLGDPETGEDEPILARGGWIAPGRFEATLCFVGTPFHPTLAVETGVGNGVATLSGPLGLGSVDRRAVSV